MVDYLIHLILLVLPANNLAVCKLATNFVNGANQTDMNRLAISAGIRGMRRSSRIFEITGNHVLSGLQIT
jgi:hypothetical protein